MDNSFRTTLSFESSDWTIKHDSGVLLLGSCFADHIGDILSRHKFRMCCNPLGTLFSPLAINRVLEHSINGNFPGEKIVQRGSQFYHYDVHSDFSGWEEGELVKTLEDTGQFVRDFLSSAQYLVISWGTAWCYRHIEIGEYVANCHKVPGKYFNKELLSIDQILEDFKGALEKIMEFNPDIRVLLTVSPVRHTRDTLPLNSVSKSTLRLAAHHAVSEFNNVRYFPSFEIMNDDLRDYRFYQRDMIHPNDVAIAYIFDKFSEVYFDRETTTLMQEWDAVMQSLRHKPREGVSREYREFLLNLKDKMKLLSSRLDIKEEFSTLERKITQVENAK